MKEVILTGDAPAPIGPYSQAVKARGSLLFTAGQIPLDPKSGEIVGTNAAEQTEQVLKNLAAVLKAGGGDFSGVVKTTIFLKNMSDFAEVNRVYSLFFTSNPPARSTVEVSRLPKDVLVEIECVASFSS